jgi:hypothetical protein
MSFLVVLSGLVVSVVATGPKVPRVQTQPKAMDFKGDKNQQHAFHQSKYVSSML